MNNKQERINDILKTWEKNVIYQLVAFNLTRHFFHLRNLKMIYS